MVGAHSAQLGFAGLARTSFQRPPGGSAAWLAGRCWLKIRCQLAGGQLDPRITSGLRKSLAQKACEKKCQVGIKCHRATPFQNPLGEGDQDRKRDSQGADPPVQPRSGPLLILCALPGGPLGQPRGVDRSTDHRPGRRRGGVGGPIAPAGPQSPEPGGR